MLFTSPGVRSVGCINIIRNRRAVNQSILSSSNWVYSSVIIDSIAAVCQPIVVPKSLFVVVMWK